MSPPGPLVTFHFSSSRQKINTNAVPSGVSNISLHELINEVPTPLLTAFENLADTYVKSVIQHSALKYCSLDPMP